MKITYPIMSDATISMNLIADLTQEQLDKIEYAQIRSFKDLLTIIGDDYDIEVTGVDFDNSSIELDIDKLEEWGKIYNEQE